VYCKQIARELASQAITSSIKKLEFLTQARFFALRSLHEINAVQNISKLTFVNIDSLSSHQHLFDNINKQITQAYWRDCIFLLFFWNICKMPYYTPNDIIFVFGECRCNYQQAIKLHRDCFPDRQMIEPKWLNPNDWTIAQLVLHQRQGPVKKQQKHCINIPKRDDPQVVAVLAMITINLHVSRRQIQRELGIPKSIAYRILVTHNFHSYHIVLMEDLTPDDFRRRLMFCDWAQTILQRDSTFFRYVLFSDEATFHNTEST